MSNEFIKTERQDGVVLITLHDPATRNAVSQEMARELLDELDRFDDDPEDRVLLLTGTEPSFCSGANVRRFDRDIQEREAVSEEPDSLPWGRMEARLGTRERQDRALGARVPLRIHDLQKPSIAAVNGHAVGLGMGLALACDIRIASEKAVFSEAFVRMGLIPGDGSCWQLPPSRRPGQHIPSSIYWRPGRRRRGVPHGPGRPRRPPRGADARCIGAGVEDRPGAPSSPCPLIKYLVHRSLDTGLEESLELAHVAQDIARGTEDHKEAVQAFLEKREPRFKGR